MDQKKIEISNNIDKINNELKLLDEDLAFAPQSASYYKLYQDNVNRLNEQLSSLKSKYNELLTPEELLIKNSQLKDLHLLQEQKQKEEIEKMRVKQQEQMLLLKASHEENKKREFEIKQKMTSTLENESKRYLESIQDNLANKDFLTSELNKLENWWDELTQFGQPCNATYLLALYQSKKKILDDLIKI
jgi:hypothetical protein